MPMPKLPLPVMLAACLAREEYLVTACLSRGRLRASKPYRNPTTIFEASVNYIWRHLCFHCADARPHSCLPVGANWDLYRVTSTRDDKDAARRASLKDLDDLVKRLLHALPLKYQAGTIRWGRALGFKV